MEDIGNVDDLDRSARKAGDPLGCECPVCQRINGLVENARLGQDVGQGVHLGVSKDVGGRPQNGARQGEPNSEQVLSLKLAEDFWGRFQRGPDDEENDATDAEVVACI